MINDNFKSILAKAKEWWGGLAEREKQAVSIGGFVVLLFLIYQCWLSPLYSSIATLRKRIVTQQRTLAWMQAADKEIAQLQKQNQHSSEKPVSVVAMLASVQKQINQAGLQGALSQLKQSGNESVEVHFQKVEFDKLIALLTAIMKEHNVMLTQMSVIADQTPGIVNADLLIGR